MNAVRAWDLIPTATAWLVRGWVVVGWVVLIPLAIYRVTP